MPTKLEGIQPVTSYLQTFNREVLYNLATKTPNTVPLFLVAFSLLVF